MDLRPLTSPALLVVYSQRHLYEAIYDPMINLASEVPPTQKQWTQSSSSASLGGVYNDTGQVQKTLCCIVP